MQPPLMPTETFLELAREPYRRLMRKEWPDDPQAPDTTVEDDRRPDPTWIGLRRLGVALKAIVMRLPRVRATSRHASPPGYPLRLDCPPRCES